jgi:HEAT repeat protein
VADRQRELDELSERMERSEAAPPEPTAVIAERLTASEPDTRATAAYDLGRIGGPGAVAPLTAALSDPDGGVRRSAGRSLATIAATTPVPWKPIAAQLAAKDPGIRADTARCLGGLEAREAASDLAATLSSEREARTRLALVEALGRIHDPAGLPALRAIANDKAATPELALAAVQALGAGKAHALAATPDLIAALRHSSRSVREAAATALATATGEDFGSDVERWMAWAAKAR